MSIYFLVTYTKCSFNIDLCLMGCIWFMMSMMGAKMTPSVRLTCQCAQLSMCDVTRFVGFIVIQMKTEVAHQHDERVLFGFCLNLLVRTSCVTRVHPASLFFTSSCIPSFDKYTLSPRGTCTCYIYTLNIPSWIQLCNLFMLNRYRLSLINIKSAFSQLT